MADSSLSNVDDSQHVLVIDSVTKSYSIQPLIRDGRNFEPIIPDRAYMNTFSARHFASEHAFDKPHNDFCGPANLPATAVPLTRVSPDPFDFSEKILPKR